MAKSTHGFTKRALISKANKRIVVATAIATFVFMFSAVATNSLIQQMAYQNKVIGQQRDALKIAKDSLDATDSLVVAYEAFKNTPQNMLGGNPTGTGDIDGDNTRIILDALPARYDYPAITSSIEKLVVARGLRFVDMTGSDDALAQAQNASSSKPEPIEMPFEFSVIGGYDATQALLTDLERSIRPFKIIRTEITASNDSGEVSLLVSGSTFFQPAKNLNMTEEVVKP